MNHRAEGPLQNLYLTLILVAVGAAAMYGLVGGIALSQGVSPSNESVFTAYADTFVNTSASVNNLGDKLQEASGADDIIGIMLTNGFSVLLDVLTAPVKIFNVIINKGLYSMGMGSFSGYAQVAILSLAIFGIIALIMKVRA